MLVWEWPQLVMLGCVSAAVVLHVCKHGEPRPPWHVGFGTLRMGILVALLYFGGFWTGGN